MTLSELEAKLATQRQQLADIEAERATLEAEQQTIEGQKRPLSGKAILDNDKEAAETLRRYNARLTENLQRDEDLGNAASILSDRITRTLGEIVTEKKRLAAVDGIEIAKKRAEAGAEVEKHLQAAAAAAQYLRDSGPAVNDFARRIDPKAANNFSSKTFGRTLEERLACYFKPFGCQELVTFRATMLPDQLKAEAEFFEANM